MLLISHVEADDVSATTAGKAVPVVIALVDTEAGHLVIMKGAAGTPIRRQFYIAFDEVVAANGGFDTVRNTLSWGFNRLNF